MTTEHLLVNNEKNRNRDAFSFANINLLARCNVNCFFCLGKDIEEELAPFNCLTTPFEEWPNFEEFLRRCEDAGIRRLYVTGQNTDSLLYDHLDKLICYLRNLGFGVGLRTNGYKALEMMDVINECNLSAGYSIHSLSPTTNRMIMGRSDLPDWHTILQITKRPRVSIVLNRCNESEFFKLLQFIAKYRSVRYVQVRRVSTDTRLDELAPDIAAYERVYTKVRDVFEMKDKIFGDAEVYEIYGQDVVFWRTVKTTVNSYNYFTDGTISDCYFVVEGYLKNRKKPCQIEAPVAQG